MTQKCCNRKYAATICKRNNGEENGFNVSNKMNSTTQKDCSRR